MSPMCTYSAGEDGIATDWHLVHLGSRAVGRCGLLLTEATAVTPGGRISTGDLGLWDDAQIEPLARIVSFCRAQGSRIAAQLAHAGRKAWSPHKGAGPDIPVGPTDVPFDEGWVAPRPLTAQEIEAVIVAWREAARRALAADFDAIEIHAAHGYLLHQFLTPLVNRRIDEYGGSLENRARLMLRVAAAVREVWPADRPLLLRVSAFEWTEGGLTPADFVALAPRMREAGIDMVDCSSGGAIPMGPPAGRIGPGYQVPFAEEIRVGSGLPTIAVGLITEPEQADAIVQNEQADMIALGRELLREPYWPLAAAKRLEHPLEWPWQYLRAKG